MNVIQTEGTKILAFGLGFTYFGALGIHLNLSFSYNCQWWIQFPDGAGTNPKGNVNQLFGKRFVENCMKLKEIVREWGGGIHP